MIAKLLLVGITILHQENMQLAKMIAALAGRKSIKATGEWIKSADEFVNSKLNEIIDEDNEVDDGK